MRRAYDMMMDIFLPSAPRPIHVAVYGTSERCSLDSGHGINPTLQLVAQVFKHEKQLIRVKMQCGGFKQLPLSVRLSRLREMGAVGEGSQDEPFCVQVERSEAAAAQGGILERLQRLEAQQAACFMDKAQYMGTLMYEAQPSEWTQVLSGIPALRVTMSDVLAGLVTATDEVFEAAAQPGVKENPAVQNLVFALADDLCKLGNRGLHACDTHARGYPVNPQARMDMTLTTQPHSSMEQVLWSAVAGWVVAKPDLSTPNLKEGLAQLMEHANLAFEQQPERKWALGILADGHTVQVVRFTRYGQQGIVYSKSQSLPLSRSASSDGLRVLAQVLLSSSAELGYVAPPVLGKFSVDKAGQEWEVQPLQVLQARGTLVYSCRCSCSTATDVDAVLKLGSESEASIIRYLNSKNATGVPELWHSGFLMDGRHHFIITPLGRPVALSLGEECIFKVARDVAITLEGLYNLQVTYGDVAPPNIIVAKGMDVRLIDYHTAWRRDEEGEVPLITRRAFMSMSRLHGGAVTLSGELESLMYTLLYWFCDGHLDWQNDGCEMLRAAQAKFYTMRPGFEEHIISKCKEASEEAKAVLRRLKDLFFPPGREAEFREDVTVAEFLEALQT